MAAQAVGLGQRGALVKTRVEARRQERRVGEGHDVHLPHRQQGGVRDGVPDEVVGAERHAGLILRQIVDRERGIVRAPEDDKGALPQEPPDIDARDVAV